MNTGPIKRIIFSVSLVTIWSPLYGHAHVSSVWGVLAVVASVLMSHTLIGDDDR